MCSVRARAWGSAWRRPSHGTTAWHDSVHKFFPGRDRTAVRPLAHARGRQEGTCQNRLEGLLHVGGIEGRGLNEREGALLSVALGVICGHGAQVAEVALVAPTSSP